EYVPRWNLYSNSFDAAAQCFSKSTGKENVEPTGRGRIRGSILPAMPPGPIRSNCRAFPCGSIIVRTMVPGYCFLPFASMKPQIQDQVMVSNVLQIHSEFRYFGLVLGRGIETHGHFQLSIRLTRRGLRTLAHEENQENR